MFEAAWSIPDPGDCELEWTDTELSLSADGPFPGACRGDTFLVADPPQLLYGLEFVLADMRCIRQEPGVTCEHRPSGSGFRGSRDRYDLF